jgi:hypothetical protein
LEFGRHAASLTPVRTRVQRQPIQTLLVIRAYPALQSPKLDPVLAGQLGQRHAVFECGPQQTKPLERLVAP